MNMHIELQPTPPPCQQLATQLCGLNSQSQPRRHHAGGLRVPYKTCVLTSACTAAGGATGVVPSDSGDVAAAGEVCFPRRTRTQVIESRWWWTMLVSTHGIVANPGEEYIALKSGGVGETRCKEFLRGLYTRLATNPTPPRRLGCPPLFK